TFSCWTALLRANSLPTSCVISLTAFYSHRTHRYVRFVLVFLRNLLDSPPVKIWNTDATKETVLFDSA
ncbi:hypothetical protein OSTOST_09176, partial [Ostertagia ostertagi]